MAKIKNEPFFVWPPKMNGDPSKRNQKLRCSYHRDKGHKIEDCEMLKKHLEELVAAGHLKDFVDSKKGKKVERPEPHHLQQNQENAPRPVINMILELLDAERENELRGQIKKAEHIQHVLSVQQVEKKARVEPLFEITFSEKDLNRVQHPHNDALVVTLAINNFDVKRILIDPGASTEIMYFDLFQNLGLTEKDLTLVLTPLVGFNSQPEWPLGRVVLPVQAKSVVKMTEFLVVKVSSPYNAIMGRTWLHEMKAIASTYHQVIKFSAISNIGSPEHFNIEEVFGDQISAKMCFMTAMKGKGKAEQVQIIEVPDQPVLEDVGKEPKKKVVEDLETVQIDESNFEKFFLLGTSLTQTERAQMLEFLYGNLEVFAWTPYEMPGLDPNFICHKLNVDPTARPMVQKSQRAVP